MPDVKMPVVILAGGFTPQKILDAGETEKERAFIDIGGRPMLQWVLDAVRNSDCCGEILCIGNSARMMSTFGLKPEEVAEDKGSMLDNFVTGMERFRSHPRVLSMTCDIPLLTAESLQDVVDSIATIDAEIYYPIIDVKYYDEKFPGGKRTTQYLKEGTFTGGNVFVLNPERVLGNLDKIKSVIRDRKSPAKLVRLFGLPFIMRFAFKQLDLKGLENKASQILGAKMRGVITHYPEIGFDVDKPEDLTMVRKIIAKQAGGNQKNITGHA
jgi:molybdopterin-guanine dinucleotide biosynthesis protein A